MANRYIIFANLTLKGEIRTANICDEFRFINNKDIVGDVFEQKFQRGAKAMLGRLARSKNGLHLLHIGINYFSFNESYESLSNATIGLAATELL